MSVKMNYDQVVELECEGEVLIDGETYQVLEVDERDEIPLVEDTDGYALSVIVKRNGDRPAFFSTTWSYLRDRLGGFDVFNAEGSSPYLDPVRKVSVIDQVWVPIDMPHENIQYGALVDLAASFVRDAELGAGLSASSYAGQFKDALNGEWH